MVGGEVEVLVAGVSVVVEVEAVVVVVEIVVVVLEVGLVVVVKLLVMIELVMVEVVLVMIEVVIVVAEALAVVVAAVEVHAAGAQQGMDDLQRLLEPADDVLVREAESLVLRRMPAGAKPEDEPTVADLVYGIRHLRCQSRIAEAGADDERAEFHPAGHRGQRAQQRPALPDAARRPFGPLHAKQ